MINYSVPSISNIDDEFGLDEENDDNTIENCVQDRSIDGTHSSFQNTSISEEEEDVLNSTKSDLHGIRIIDNVNQDFRQSYFKVKVNENIKFVHKQSACWLLSNNISKLSNDRLSRVRQHTVFNS